MIQTQLECGPVAESSDSGVMAATCRVLGEQEGAPAVLASAFFAAAHRLRRIAWGGIAP
jgi:hypothetical protein